MKHPLSLAALTVLELSPPDMVSCAAETGYDYAGLRLIPSTDTDPHWPTLGATPLIREARRRADELGVAVWDVETLRLQPQTNVAADYERFLETGALLGARHIVVAGNDPDRGRLVHNLAELAVLAETYGLTPNLEFMPWTDVPTLDSAAAVLTQVEQTNIGLLIDSMHFDRADSDAAHLASLPPEWFHYLQLCDAPAKRPPDTETLIYQARRARLFPGDGGLDILAPLRHLPDDLVVAVETPVTPPHPMTAVERATRARDATRTVLSKLT
jgi:sugar phosphate isomerase/epimerase